jgi:threonylcarbamoyladenosine tRNA methylthiotransferase MtaB
VTEAADKDARASIRRVQRENPDAKVLVTGCYAQRAPEELAALPGVRWVVGNSHKHQVAEIATAPELPLLAPMKSNQGFVPLTDLARSRSAGELGADVFVGDIFAHTELLAAPVFDSAGERTRPNLKVQDGCDNRCSFCVIPSVRGKSRSLPMERVLSEVRSLVSSGYREVVISGINLGRWGRDLPVVGQLERLVHSIVDETTIEKLRISSVEPMDWSDGLIGLMASSPRIAKHAHVPLQSGSDAVLRRMHRKYRPWHYREKILKIRNAMPSAAIGADVMVGFPGETNEEFDETRSMIEELPFTYLHVFTYSARPGTPAAEFAKQVPTATARKRNGILREISARKKTSFMQSLVGDTVEAITLRNGNDGFTEGLTDNYLKMNIRGRIEPNCWLTVRVDGIDGEMLQARVV